MYLWCAEVIQYAVDSRRYDKYCSLITRLDEHEMKGMRREDAGNYLNMVAEKENLKFTYPAQQALIRIALCTNLGGIHAFTTIIGRSIPTARGVYYMNKVGKFPDDIQCIRPAPPEANSIRELSLCVLFRSHLSL